MPLGFPRLSWPRDGMGVDKILSGILFWLLVALLVVAAYMVAIRVIRRYWHFPIPAFMVRFINSPLRTAMQPPQQVVDWIRLEEGMTVLEVGPGPGTFTFEAARRLGSSGTLIAVDIQPSVISRLEERVGAAGATNIRPRVADAYALPFPDKTFDRAFLVAVLAEIPERGRALMELRRVLKDDGMISIGELLIDPDYPRRKTVKGWCREAGLVLAGEEGNIWHYLLSFRKGS